ncbi:hypothetical protein DMB66_36835 [Actinoplanes sp. ATCC 53533]|nr:hypothetical protein DMB66_36835 [Actinoplanes sp. ATCC 53533]
MAGAADPVFLDRTGRRRRLFVAAGSGGGLVLLIASVALVAGFTGTGPGSVPGWPGGTDELRVGRPDSAVSVRPRTTRPPAPTTAAVRRTTAPAALVTTVPAPASATPSSTPAASVNPHRRVPTHTPNPRKSKDK